MTKQMLNYNWPEIAEEFLEKYDQDYLTKKHIPDIAADFRIEYKLNEQVSYTYIDRAVRKFLGWLPCCVCRKPSVMQTGDIPPKNYCQEHIPPFKINIQNLESRNLANTQSLAPRKTIGKIDYDDIPGYIGKVSVDVEGESIGKKPILSLNFRHNYYKLENDEFTTMRGKSLYYKNFKVNGQPHKLQREDIIRITKQKEFYCLCELTDISLKRICDCSLEFLKNDAECDSITINSKQDFVKGINSLRAPHWTQAILDSHMTVLYLKKILTADPRVDENLANTQSEVIPKTIGKIEGTDTPPDQEEELLEVVKKGKKFSISANTPGILKRYKTCGDKGCKCAKGEKHGPYYYQYYWDSEKKKQKQKYLGRAPA